MSKSYKRGQTLCTTPHCAQPTTKQSFVCKQCIQFLTMDLGSAPGLVDELNTTLARLDVLAPGGQLGDAGALLHKPRASEALFVLTNTVTTWTRLVVEHYAVPVPDSIVQASASTGTTAAARVAQGAARWLFKHVRSLAMHPAAGEAVGEIASAVKLAYNTVDRPPDLIPAGVCGYEGCEAILYADAETTTITCRKCGSDHDADVRRAWMQEGASEHRLLGMICLSWVKLLRGERVPPGTWRRWVSQGEVVAHQLDHVGRPLYRFGDVLERVERWVEYKQERARELAGRASA